MTTPAGPARAAEDARWRLFVALPLPEAVREALDGQLEPYRGAFPDARWLDPDGWHVTLLFLGQMPAIHVAALTAACAAVAAARPSFDLDVAGGGGRSRRGEGVAWLRVRAGARGVIELAEDVDRAVARAHLGGPQPRRAPSAHVTVARRAQPVLTRALQDEAHGPLRAGWQADRMRLMRSHLARAGARYEVLHEALLGMPRAS